MTTSTGFRSRGARALVILHERNMREFLTTWRAAKAADIALPSTDHAAYASLDALLHHVLRAARGYLTWICESLELPDPGVRKTPAIDVVQGEAGDFLEHLFEKWNEHLAAIDDDSLENSEFKSRWGVTYCIDGMLEHAVMHPLRHGFQLEELISER